VALTPASEGRIPGSAANAARDAAVALAIEAAGMGVWEIDVRTRDVTWTELKRPGEDGRPRRCTATEDAFLAGIHADDREAARLAIEDAIVERQDLSMMFRTAAPGGESAWIEWKGRIASEADSVPARIVGVSTDVTERELRESQMRQTQKMEAVGQLAGGIAHDFNNLLTAILGYSKLAGAGLAPDERRRCDIDEITKAAERAASLTRQLLAFSRNQVLRSAIIDLNALVRGVSEMLRRLIGEQVLLDVVLASDLALVLADAGQLEQVVVNLSVNARDAMGQGGRLTLQTANVELHAATGLPGQVVVPGWYVMLAVIDTGVGMDPHTKRHLFEPFFTTKERGKGTGLGLATVYGIVKQSSGYIWAESEPGKGAAFRVYLPRAVSQVALPPPPVAAPSTERGAERLLLVEDEASVRHLAGRVLEDAGYHVLYAPSGPQAESIFAEQHGDFDLLVTDVIMPGMSGPELFRRLTTAHPGLKVVYMSGYANETTSRQLELDAGQCYLQKPFTADQLVSCVRGALDGLPVTERS
jgi:two-component system cell cycle sensor histidine kinase/response regulator CckA